MIDVSKCEFEEAFDVEGGKVYYFTYPKELAEFPLVEDGVIVGMCISLTIQDDGEPYMMMASTIGDEDYLYDFDWRDLYEGEHYSMEDVKELIKKGEAQC